MNEFNLKYFKDTDGKYILKRKVAEVNEEKTGYILHTGNSSCNLILGKDNFEKKLQHRLEDMVYEVEDFVKKENKVYEKDILSEKIVATIQDEAEFNPFFKQLPSIEKEVYTKNSKKVRIVIDFEFHLKPSKYLAFKSLLRKFGIEH